LYSDKIGAIIREYVTNAIDAHTEASIEKPIEITLPTIFSKDFVIRDFGKGLSDKQIVEIFASYGASTKRQSNAFTGMLGIGSKSAFSYTNSFTVISRHNGTQTTYQAFIDESNIGTIASIHQQPTNESGLSIHVTVKPNDINQFNQSLIRFFKLINYRPTILGTDVKLSEPEITMKGSCWGFVYEPVSHLRRDRHLHVVMGNVTYSTTLEVLSKQLEAVDLKWLEDVRNSNLIIYAPIGKVKPSASRESLEFNEVTKLYIIDTLRIAKSEFAKTLNDRFDKCKSHYEKHCVAYQLTTEFGQLVPVGIRQWCINIKSDFLAQLDETIKFKEIIKSFPYLLDKGNINVMPNTKYIIHDSSQKVTHIANRVNEYFEAISDNTKYIVVLKFQTPEHKQRFTNHPSFIGAEFIDAGTLSFQGAVKTALKSEEAKLYRFVRGANLNIESWRPSENPPANAVYIEISSFKPKRYEENICINNALDYLRSAFGISIPTIYGVKTADLKKTLQPTWIELKDYLIQKINEWKNDNPDNVRDYELFMEANTFQKELVTDFKYLYHLKPHLESYYKRESNYFHINNCMKTFGVSVFQYNPPEEFERLYERYPFMKAFCCTMSYGDKIRLIKYLDMS
jgi:hypothetical protein